MRFHYFALASNPNANAMKIVVSKLRYVFSYTLVNLGPYLMIMNIFSLTVIFMSVKRGIEVLPMKKTFASSDQMQATKTHSVIKA